MGYKFYVGREGIKHFYIGQSFLRGSKFFCLGQKYLRYMVNLSLYKAECTILSQDRTISLQKSIQLLMT